MANDPYQHPDGTTGGHTISGRRIDDVDDPDDRLLGDAGVVEPCPGEQRGAQQGEDHREDVRKRIVPGMRAQRDRDADSERGDLGERQVDEDDAALDDVQPEVDE